MKRKKKPLKKRNNVKATALFYTVIVGLLISIVLGSFITLSAFWNSGISQAEEQRAMRIGLNEGLELCLRTDQALFNGVSFSIGEVANASVKKEAMGSFDKCTCRVESLHDTLEVTTLVGGIKYSTENYMEFRDTHRPIRVGGTTSIYGDVSRLEAGFSKDVIGGSYFNGDLSFQWKNPDQQALTNKVLRFSQRNELIRNQRFGAVWWGQERPVKDGLRLESDDEIVIDDQLGYFTQVFSTKAIYVEEGSQLKQVQLVAPYIFVAEGVSLEGHLWASDSVRIAKECTLSYPSSITAVGRDSVRVYIEENTSLVGELHVVSETQQAILKMEEGSFIEGDVFVNGAVSIQGEIAGTLQAHSSFYSNTSSYFGNTLFNTHFSSDFSGDSLVVGSLSDRTQQIILRYEE